jgi:hypothetical protein
MFLYHVSLDLSHKGVFVPRVPENADFYDEEDETPRICFAPTLEGCLTSMPVGCFNLKETLKETEYVIKVFRLDPRKHSIAPNKIVPPQELQRMGYVEDAWATGEHWVLQPLRFSKEDACLIRILSFDIGCLGKQGLKPSSKYVNGDVDVVVGLKTVML